MRSLAREASARAPIAPVVDPGDGLSVAEGYQEEI